jgi:LacI family transcriptional regulator
MSMDQIKQAPRSARVTIRTVAADAGVSVAAVSKVLRNAYGVSDTLRQNVMTSIDRLGYRPSVAARGMRGQTYTIGILLVEIANPYLPEIIDGVNDVLGPSNYQAMVGIGRSNMPLEASLIESMIDYHMDGLILVSPQMAGASLSKFARQIPIVALAHHEPTSVDFDTVNADDQSGARLATNALLLRGYADTTMISLGGSGVEETNVARQREIGYLAAMAQAGLERHARIIHLPSAPHDSEGLIRALLCEPQRPRALFCWSDLHAITVINLAKKMGLSIPQELAIIGYDNSSVAALPLIDLASIDQAGRKQGALAAQILLSRIQGRNVPNHFLLDPTLVLRSST